MKAFYALLFIILAFACCGHAKSLAKGKHVLTILSKYSCGRVVKKLSLESKGLGSVWFCEAFDGENH